MKDQMLKMAKVKSEKDFYKKFPTEEAFMAKHGKALKKAAMGKSMVNKQLHQLTDFGNPPIAQYGSSVNPNTGMFQMPMNGKSVSQYDTMAAGYGSTPPPEGFGNVKPTGGGGGFNAGNAAMAGVQGIGQVIGGIEAIGAQKKAQKKAEQSSQLSGLALQAQQSTQKAPRKYVRPEDSLVQPGQLGSPYGTGTNYLAKNGTMIGGNPTEIQNTYAPTGDMYNDLGFEPLEETYKQYRRGGRMPKAEFGEYFQDSGQAQIGSAAGGAIAAGFGLPPEIGQLVGKVAGNLLGGAKDARKLQAEKDKTALSQSQMGFEQARSQGPLSANLKDGGYMNPEYNPQVIAKFGDYSMDQLLAPPYDADMLRAGGSIGSGYYTPPSARAMYTDRAEDGTMLDSYIRSKDDLQSITDNGRYNENLRSATSSTDRYADGRPVEKTDIYSMTKGQGDNQRVKEFLRSQTGDGAPQYSMQKSYKPLFSDQYKTVSREIGAGRGERRMADMQNFLNEGKMEHGGQMAMGGELEVGDGGHLETLSYNPNLPGGEIGMFRGASHDNGGIKTKYGENEVEVEGGEPAVKLQDGGQEDNLVVFGNIKINKEIADLMGDVKAKGKKFKTYIADVAKNDAKQGKRINKGLELIEGANENSAFDHLTINTGKAILQGAKSWQKINADKIKEAGLVQDSIHQTARELGVKSDRLAEGKLEQETDPSMIAKNGFGSKALNALKTTGKFLGKGIDEYGPTILSNAAPFLRPSNANEELNPDQLAPEYYALATNQVEPVQSQTYQPMLDTPYDISLNDQVNAIDSQSRAAIRAAGSNPAAQAQIMAQTLEAKNKVLGEQSRINQSNKMQVYDKNRAALNDAQLKNLAINDQQYVRQSQAKSNTKAQTQAALNSISAKVAQQRAANRKLAVMENMYNFRFSPSGRAINANGLASFDTSGAGSRRSGLSSAGLPANKRFTIDSVTGEPVGIRTLTKSEMEGSGPSPLELDNYLQKNGGKTPNTKARNSSIVRALKSL